MSTITRYELLHAVFHHDADDVRSLLQEAKRQDIPLSARIYPNLPQILHALYKHIGAAPMADRQWNILPDTAYEILELLRPFYDFGEHEKLYQNHFLFHPVMHGDIRMLEYLWTLEPLKYRSHAQPLWPLFKTAVQDYCYMCLPEWEGLPPDKEIEAGYSLDLGAKDLLEILYAQAERCQIAPPEHLDFLLKHGCPQHTGELRLRIHQPCLELKVGCYGQAEDRRVWEITDSRLTHDQGQDCGEMVKGCLRDGEYWPLTCECGFPECAGVTEPVLAMRFGDIARWRVTSSEDDKDPSIYYRAVPVRNYLRNMDMLLEVVERGIRQDGVVSPDAEDGPDYPVTDFSASPNSLKKVKMLRKLIRCALKEGAQKNHK